MHRPALTTHLFWHHEGTYETAGHTLESGLRVLEKNASIRPIRRRLTHLPTVARVEMGDHENPVIDTAHTLIDQRKIEDHLLLISDWLTNDLLHKEARLVGCLDTSPALHTSKLALQSRDGDKLLSHGVIKATHYSDRTILEIFGVNRPVVDLPNNIGYQDGPDHFFEHDTWEGSVNPESPEALALYAGIQACAAQLK